MWCSLLYATVSFAMTKQPRPLTQHYLNTPMACAAHLSPCDLQQSGCPIDVICNKGAGSSLLLRPRRLEEVVRAVAGCINKPVIVKIR